MKRELVGIARYTKEFFSKPRKKILLGGLPVLADLVVPDGWAVTQEADGKRVRFAFEWARSSDTQRRFASHLVRDKFMEIKDAGHALDFFQYFGPLHTSASTVGEIGVAESVTYEYVRSYQQHFRDAMLWSLGDAPHDWAGTRDLTTEEGRNALRRDFALDLLRPPAMTLEMGRSRTANRKHQVVGPFFRVESTDIASAVWASIYLDKARKLDGAVCAHCGDVFIRSGRQDKKYCDRSQCNGTRRVTNYRREKRKAEAIKNGKA